MSDNYENSLKLINSIGKIIEEYRNKIDEKNAEIEALKKELKPFDITDLTTRDKYWLYEEIYRRDDSITWEKAHQELREYILKDFAGVSEHNIDEHINSDFEKFNRAYGGYKKRHPDL